MATATAVFTPAKYPNGNDNSQRNQHLYGTIAVQASPATYVTGGLPLTIAPGSAEAVKSLNPTNFVWADVDSITAGNGYTVQLSASKLRISVAGAELTNGEAIPSGVSGDTIQAHLVVSRN